MSVKQIRIVHIGDKEVFERTNPDYVDNVVSKLAKQYQECPEEWRGVFLSGLPKKDLDELRERGVI